MDANDVEPALRERMKARARELDRSTPAAPTLAEIIPADRNERPSMRLRSTLGLGLAVAIVAAIVLGLAVWSLRSPGKPAAGDASGSPRTTPTVSLDAPRYDDGIPRGWQGQPVLRGQAAIDEANAATDASSFLVAFWAGIMLPSWGCGPIMVGDNGSYLCGQMLVGDQPGVESFALGKALRVDTSEVAPGPVIARVHTNDPTMMTCPASYAAGCVHTMVGEAVVWHGDAETAPRPTTVAQAAAAFGVPSKPVAGICEGQFPGVAVLQYPSQGAEGVIAVFPSTAALAAVAPDAVVHGESDVPPTGSQSCASSGTDPLRGPGIFSFKIHWLARGNVLVAVQYDTSVGPNNDVMVAQLRAQLATLSAAGQSLLPTLTPSPGPSATSGSGSSS